MQAIIDFIMGHSVVLAGVGVAILDLVFAMNPKTETNGILHWIYAQLTKVKEPKV